MKGNRNIYRILGVTSLLLMALLVVFCIKKEYKDINNYPDNGTGIPLCINEVMYANLGLLKDSDGDNSDWIEIYNYGSEPVNLLGISIADDVSKLGRWTFPDYNLGAGEYLVIWASGKNKITSDGEFHTDFLVSPHDKITLYDENNKQIDAWELNESVPVGLSAGRLFKEPETIAILSNSSPGAANNASPVYYVVKVDKLLKAPTFSHESGFYDDEFLLKLKSNDDDSCIVYTLDGTEPGAESAVYTEPILIKDRSMEKNVLGDVRTTYNYDAKFKWENTYNYKGTVVRARTMKDGILSKEIVSKSYFISPETSFNLVSLTVEPDDMFDERDGIYVPGKVYQLWKKSNKKTEGAYDSPANYYGNEKIDGHIQIFDNGGGVLADSEVKVSIAGGTSRSQPVKGLRVAVSDKESYFDGDLFEILPIDKNDLDNNECDAITLRASGTEFNITMFRDVLATSLIADKMNVQYLAAQPSELFIDGEYWGIHNIREVCDEDYFFRHYGIDSSKLNLIKSNMSAGFALEVSVGTEEDIRDYNELISYVCNYDMNDQDCYEYVCSKVDIDNLIDYCIAQIYYSNSDWPGNNYRIWRANQPDSEFGDNKWRFVLFDLDTAFLYSEFNSIDYIFGENHGKSVFENGQPYHDENRELFYSLIKNKSFEEKFFDRLEECLDTTFSSENVLEKIEKMEALYAPEMKAHFSRWHITDGWLTKLRNMIKYNRSYDDTYSYEKWENNVEEMKEFARKRPEILKGYIRQYREING